MASSVNPDQTVPLEAIQSGFPLFARQDKPWFSSMRELSLSNLSSKDPGQFAALQSHKSCPSVSK